MTKPSESPPVLSVVTISWNQKDDIAEYLAAMEKTRSRVDFPIEMVLVDNGSVDGTIEMVREEFPWVKLVENGRNVGFAAGCNAGMHVSTGTYILLFNPDARAAPQAFKGMVRYLRENRSAGGVGCMMLHDDGLPQRSAYRELSPWNYVLNHSMIYPALEKVRKIPYRLGFGKGGAPREVDWVQAACLMVPRTVYEKVGDMDDSFFIYCEDTDWCHRIRKAGYRIVYMPNLRIRHRQMGSVGRKPEYFFRRVYRSIVHYTNRQFEPPRDGRILRTMWWDMRLRVPAYRVLQWLKPSQAARYGERIRSVRRMLRIIEARDPDLFDDPPPR